ncbi:hypothetical protein AB0C65_38625 [Nocardia sp. NPDC048505]|uniref:hypothetical protein n=1 Tax=Nocardia sp. NPDC048505 TaxID=3155756 RepID=UPI0033F5E24F
MTTQTITLDLRAYGHANTTITRTGPDVVYTVTARHLRGSFTLSPLTPLASAPGEGVEVRFGRNAAPAAEHPDWQLYADKPVVHRVILTETVTVHRKLLPGIAYHPLYLKRERRDGASEFASDAVRRRATATVAAIATDYLARADLAELHHAHSIRAAQARLSGALATVSRAEQWINHHMRELVEARADLIALQRLASGEEVHSAVRWALSKLPAN